MAPSRRETTSSLPEAARLRALLGTGFLDSPLEASLDRFARMAARLLRAPMATVILEEEAGHVFRGAFGLSEPHASMRETPLSAALCRHVVTIEQPLLVADARLHGTLRSQRAVGELGGIAFAGVPMMTSNAQTVGAICVVDIQARSWSDDEVATLRDLATTAMLELQLRELTRVLSQSDAHFRAIFDGMDTGVVLSDSARRVAWANSSAEYMLDYAPSELLGMRWFDLSNPADRESDRELHAQLLEGSRTRVTCTKQMKKKDGSWLWVRLTLSTLRDPQKKRVLVVGAFEDLSSAKLLEEKLKDSHDRYRALVQNLTGCALLSFDRDLRYVVAEGDQLLALAGLTAEGLIGKTVSELVGHTPHGKRLEQAYRSALRGENSTVEIRFGPQWFRCHVGPIREQGRLVQGGMALVFCSTETHRLTDQVRVQTGAMAIILSLASDHTSGMSLRALLSYFLDRLCRELGFAVAHVFVREGGDMVSTKLWFVDDTLRFGPFTSASTGVRFPSGQGLPGRVLAAQAPIAIEDVASDLEFTRTGEALRTGLHSGVGFPVWLRGQIAVVIECFASATDACGPEQLVVMAQLGRVFGRVLEREQLALTLDAVG